jgi:hypothetical protein
MPGDAGTKVPVKAPWARRGEHGTYKGTFGLHG